MKKKGGSERQKCQCSIPLAGSKEATLEIMTLCATAVCDNSVPLEDIYAFRDDLLPIVEQSDEEGHYLGEDADTVSIDSEKSDKSESDAESD